MNQQNPPKNRGYLWCTVPFCLKNITCVLYSFLKLDKVGPVLEINRSSQWNFGPVLEINRSSQWNLQDFVSGDIAVFENGEKIFSKNDKGLIDVGETLLPTYTHVSAGCAYDMDNIGNTVL